MALFIRKENSHCHVGIKFLYVIMLFIYYFIMGRPNIFVNFTTTLGIKCSGRYGLHMAKVRTNSS